MFDHVHSFFLPISVSLSVCLSHWEEKHKLSHHLDSLSLVSPASSTNHICFSKCWRHHGNIWHWNYFKSRSKFCIIPEFWLSLHEHYHKHTFYHFWIKKKSSFHSSWMSYTSVWSRTLPSPQMSKFRCLAHPGAHKCPFGFRVWDKYYSPPFWLTLCGPSWRKFPLLRMRQPWRPRPYWC